MIPKTSLDYSLCVPIKGTGFINHGSTVDNLQELKDPHELDFWLFTPQPARIQQGKTCTTGVPSLYVQADIFWQWNMQSLGPKLLDQPSESPVLALLSSQGRTVPGPSSAGREK